MRWGGWCSERGDGGQGERWRKRRRSQVGRAGGQEGREGGGERRKRCVKSAQLKIRRNVCSEGKKGIFWLLSATPFHYKQACKKSKTEVEKKRKKKLDNFQIRNLKCNKSAGETTKGKTVMDYQDGEIPSENSQKNMNMW